MKHQDRVCKSQLLDAREQAKLDSATISRIASDYNTAKTSLEEFGEVSASKSQRILDLISLLRRSTAYIQEIGTLGYNGEFIPDSKDKQTTLKKEILEAITLT